MRREGSGRAAARMRERLADAFWECLDAARLDAVSVGDVIAAAGVSRGSFYYHFADKDELVRWALRHEVIDVDRRGTSLVAVMAGPEPDDEDPIVARGVRRICLLIDRGGMDVAYDAMLELAIEFWTRAQRPEGGRLPDEVVAALEYGVGGLVGMLSRADASTEAQPRLRGVPARAARAPARARALRGARRELRFFSPRRRGRAVGLPPSPLGASVAVI